MKHPLSRWNRLSPLLLLACASGCAGASSSPSLPADSGAGSQGSTLADGAPASTLPPAGDDASPDDASSPPSSADGSVDGSLDASAGEGPYGSNGPSAYTTSTIQITGPNGAFTTTAYVPSGSSSPMPVVILSSGLQQPGAAYAPYAERLASWGIVALLRDDPGVLGEASPAIAQDVSYEVSTWLASANTTASGPLEGKVDTTRIGLAGHSRGGQVSLLAAEGGAHGLLKGLFGLDPVDSSADGGVGEAAASIATVGIPMAFIGETTDSAANSCAPAANNYQTLYQAASSPIVALTAIGADHTMFEDPSECAFCTLCTAGTANAAHVLAIAQRYLMAFFARQLLGDASVGAAFSGAGAGADVAAGVVSVVSK